jgi:hypothetical protein
MVLFVFALGSWGAPPPGAAIPPEFQGIPYPAVLRMNGLIAIRGTPQRRGLSPGARPPGSSTLSPCA